LLLQPPVLFLLFSLGLLLLPVGLFLFPADNLLVPLLLLEPLFLVPLVNSLVNNLTFLPFALLAHEERTLLVEEFPAQRILIVLDLVEVPPTNFLRPELINLVAEAPGEVLGLVQFLENLAHVVQDIPVGGTGDKLLVDNIHAALMKAVLGGLMEVLDVVLPGALMLPSPIVALHVHVLLFFVPLFFFLVLHFLHHGADFGEQTRAHVGDILVGDGLVLLLGHALLAFVEEVLLVVAQLLRNVIALDVLLDLLVHDLEASIGGGLRETHVHDLAASLNKLPLGVLLEELFFVMVVVMVVLRNRVVELLGAVETIVAG